MNDADGRGTEARGIELEILRGAERLRNDTVELVRRLIGFRTENPKFLSSEEEQRKALEQEGACQAFISGLFDEMNGDVDSWDIGSGRTNVVARFPGSSGGPSIILNGHIDVVPAGAIDEWKHGPWDAVVDGGRVWGRGACDMKAGIVAGISALRLLRDLGVRLRGEVVFQSVTDEEGGGTGTRAAISRGHVADAAIVLEPSDGRVILAEGGLEWLRLVVRGVGGHSAKRYRSVHAGGRGEAVNAIEKLIKILISLQDLEREWSIYKTHPLLPPGITTIHPGVILGGSGGGVSGMPTNITTIGNFSDYASLGLSIKYLPSERRDDVRDEVASHVAAVASTDAWLREHPPELEWAVGGVSFPPAELSHEHPLAQAVKRAHEAIRGPVTWAGFEAVSDLSWLADDGIPSVLFGPGSIEQAHTTAEYVEIDELVAATALVAASLVEWCGVD